MTAVVLSHSELRSLLKRTFEGLGWNTSQYEEAAETAAMGEAIGLSALDRIQTAWPRLLSTPKVLSLIPQVDETALDAQNDSILRLGQSICDLAYLYAQNSASALIEVRNCHDRDFILPSLIQCAKRDVFLIARWYSRDLAYSAITTSTQPRCIDYIRTKRSNTNQRTIHSLFIACSKSENHIQRFQEHSNIGLIDESPLDNITSEQFATNFKRSREQGIKVPCRWIEIFEQQAQNILVANSERSRAGAGD